MKSKQRPTAAAVASAAATGISQLASVRQCSKQEETTRLRLRLPQPQLQCERELKHEMARKEREAQALQKRAAPQRRPTPTPAPKPPPKTTAKITSKPTPTLKSIAKPTPMLMSNPKLKPTATATGIALSAMAKSSNDKVKQEASKVHSQPDALPHTQAAGDANVTIDQHVVSTSDSDSDDEETAKLRLQLEHLSELSQLDFEREFRQWMAQEGIESRMHTHLRMELVNSFNSSSLGKLLSRVSSSTAQVTQQQKYLLLSPLGLALHTLVAEFLYEQNCHYTLSVYCSEIPHRHALPNFDSSVQFRFNEQERQQLLAAVLGEAQREPQPQLEQTVHRAYDITHQSLLLALVKSLIATRRTVVPQACESTMTSAAGQAAEGTQTDVDTRGPYEPKELIVAADGHTVFIGSRVSQSLYGVGQQLSQLMRYIDALCKSCAPPIEVISKLGLQRLLKKEMLERQRLQGLGKILGAGEMAVQLPDLQQLSQQELLTDEDKNTVESPVGPIQLPADLPSVPKLPHLHVEQVACLATVQQILQKYEEQTLQDQDSMHTTLDRLGAMVGELAGCVQSLSNVLNLTMEQEYSVGRRKGFQQGYREGFSHGHYMGVQEGIKCQRKRQQLKDRSTQTRRLPPPRRVLTTTTQTESPQRQPAASSSKRKAQRTLLDVANQTAPFLQETVAASRSYEQWIYEMLHSRSGQIFLERVELSLNKALEQQKHRLNELFEVKMRHHAELMRLSHRQSSWRTLCRHMERDSQSSEARELVHKIFRMLEHYETHHQLIAEKIQQTELAAEQTTRMQPMWTSAEAKEVSGVLSRPTTTSSYPAPSAEAVSVPALNNLLDSGSSSVAPAPAPALAADDPAISSQAALAPTQQLTSIATNNSSQSRPRTVDSRLQALPSFNDALLSAKNRMLQLEQESDLLEQSFLGYMEHARVQKQKINIRASCARERQQIHRTLESFREWQRRIRCEDVNLTTSLPSAPSPISSSSELEQESYHFTNAIAVARRKLFSDLQSTSGAATGTIASAATAVVSPELEPEEPELTNQRLAEQVQNETQHLMNRMEATLARVSRPGSLQLLSAEAQLGNALETDLVSSSSGSTLTSATDSGGNRGDAPATPHARRKLQRSMTRMHQLFGTKSAAQSSANVGALPMGEVKTTTRPWSAPTSILNASCSATALAQRPHTAPSSRTELPPATTAGSNFMGLLDAISDVNTTTNSSSLASSADAQPLAMRELYAQLVSSVSSASHVSSSSPASRRLEFWKRMNL